MSEADDRAVADAVGRRKDDRAFSILYDRHTGAMYGLALRLSGGDAVASTDIVHDAWVRAAERLADFAGRSTLRTWLCGFVVNCARERIRGQDDRELPLDEVMDPGRDDAELTGVFDRLELEQALGAIAPGYREVLVLHDVEGYSHEEIAALCGITIGTSKSQLARARRALRRILT